MKNRVILTVLFLLTLTIVPSISGQKLKPEEVIAKHLDSIAPAEKRATIKTMIASGEVRVEFVSQKNQPATGRIVIASEGNKMFYGMQLNAGDYPFEKVIFDGSKSDVALIRAGGRSVLGNFLQANNGIISGGLVGGIYKTSWPLLSALEKGVKVSSAGNKKVDDREAYALMFSPKGSSDVEITMFFDAETFRHVRTTYKRQSAASMGRTIDESARQHDGRFTVTEDFSDFKEDKGMMLPHKYKLHYLVSASSTTEILWTAVFSEFAVNQAFDPGTFAIPK